MPTEIADSDAESDLGSPSRALAVVEDAIAHEAPLGSASIDFDQFLDTTQHLPSSASHNVNSADQLDGTVDNGNLTKTNLDSTNTLPSSFFDDMALKSKSKKRAQSALHDVTGSAREPPEKKSKTKRSKTYAANSRSRASQHDDLFTPGPNGSSLLPEFDLTNITGDTTQEIPSGSHPDVVSANPDAFDGLVQQPEQASNLLPPSKMGPPNMTTSMASMGQYESINLDFRNSGPGIDINTNPFGAFSQLSSDDNAAEVDVSDINAQLSAHTALPAASQSSPDRPLVVNPVNLLHDADTVSPIDLGNEAGTYAIHEDAADVPVPSMEKPTPKKRGRKPKNPRTSSKLDSPAPSLDDNIDELALPMAPPTRTRRGTVDSVSQASEISVTTNSSKKRKRGKSKQAVEGEVVPVPAESSPVKHPNSELNPSDEQTIGLSKEAYKPRPSRSRSKIVDEDEPAMAPVESSPAKHPASELHLSDEAAIGLPKEAYKPRPSRSRSKKTIDEDVPLFEPTKAEADPRTPAKALLSEIVEEDTPATTSTKPNTKKGRKSKVKRAKTSAAALLKKADPMLSEGEDDVMWMDSKPAPVRLDLPPDLRALKKEPDEKADEPKEGDGIDDQAGKKTPGGITIEIPKIVEVEDEPVQPKKRGRKPKKAPQKSEEKIADEEDEEDEGPVSSKRAPLTEQSTNTTVAKLKQKEQLKAPTVSPITSPEPEDVQPAIEKENQKPITTPAKPKASATPSSTDKGPTKHSPINPPSLNSGRKALYRVGLSKRQNIPSLLRKVDREKKGPKNVAPKQKVTKGMENALAEYNQGREGEDVADVGEMRGADGMLVEWEF